MTTCDHAHAAPTCGDPACYREEAARTVDRVASAVGLPGLGDLVRRGLLDPKNPKSPPSGDVDDRWSSPAIVVRYAPVVRWTVLQAFSTDPFSLDELLELEKHLDDETEWETIDEFWQVWSPRLNNRLRRLLTAALKVARDAKCEADRCPICEFGQPTEDTASLTRWSCGHWLEKKPR